MLTNFEYLEKENLPKIGLWKHNNKIVAATLFDHSLDSVFLVTLKHYKFLYKRMLEYAIENMAVKGMDNFSILIQENDNRLKNIAKRKGFLKSDWKETVLKYDLKNPIDVPNLGNEYKYISLKECLNFKDYDFCLFRGFDHEKDQSYSFDSIKESLYELHYKKNFVDLTLKTSIIDKSNDQVAHCGTWHDSKSDFAIVEPVCVIPGCRKKGLGSAVVLAGLKKSQLRGAKFVIVNSDLNFYKKIGFKDYLNASYWVNPILKKE